MSIVNERHCHDGAERLALRWAAAGVWQWQEFDSREELLAFLSERQDYFYDPEWPRGTQIWRLDASSNTRPLETTTQQRSRS